jgi:hypothetical protein
MEIKKNQFCSTVSALATLAQYFGHLIFIDEKKLGKQRGGSSDYSAVGSLAASGSLVDTNGEGWTKKTARKSSTKAPRRRPQRRQGSKPLKDRTTPSKPEKTVAEEPPEEAPEPVVKKAEPPREPSLALPDISQENVVTENNDEMDALFSKPKNGKEEDEDIFDSDSDDDEMDSLFQSPVKKNRQSTEDIFVSSPRASAVDSEMDASIEETPKKSKRDKKSKRSEKKGQKSKGERTSRGSKSGSSERTSRSSRGESSERKSRSGKSRSSKKGKSDDRSSSGNILDGTIGADDDELDDLFAVKPKSTKPEGDLDDLFTVKPKPKQPNQKDDDDLDDLFSVSPAQKAGKKPGHRRRGSATGSSRGSGRGSESRSRRSTQGSDIFAVDSSGSSSD